MAPGQAEKLKELPAGTMRQQLRIRELRQEVRTLEKALEADRLYVTGARLMNDEVHLLDRMAILLQDAFNLKLLLSEVKPGAREQLSGITFDEKLVGPSSLAKKMEAVSKVELADDGTLEELLKRGMELREKQVGDMLKRTRENRRLDLKEKKQLSSATYQLALLKSFSSKPDIGKQLMQFYYDEVAPAIVLVHAFGSSTDAAKLDLIEALVRNDVTAGGGPEAWVANLKVGLSNISRGFESLRRRVEELTRELNDVGDREAKLVEGLRKAGFDCEFGKTMDERTAHMHEIEAKLEGRRRELVGVVKEVVEGTKEIRMKEFSGFAGERLKELAAFWEAFREHSAAALRLAKIYFEMKEWEKAKIWAEEDVNRSFADLDMDCVTQALQLALKICTEAGDRKGADEIKKRLDAHLAISKLFKKPELFAVPWPKERRDIEGYG